MEENTVTESQEKEKSYKQTFLDIEVEKGDLDSIAMIMTKTNLSKEFLNTFNFPESVPSARIADLYKAAMEILAENQRFEKNWWKEVASKYKLTGQIYFDFEQGKFYTLEEVKVDEVN